MTTNVPTKEVEYICLSLIVIDSVFELGKNYYLQTSL